MSKAQQNSDALNAQLVNLEAIRKNANKVLSKINAQHDKARAKGVQLSEKQVEKLRGLYEQAYTLSQDERQVAIVAAELVAEMINTTKRKSEGGGGRGKKRRNTPVQQHPISQGAMVAANHDGQWILGRVQEFDFSSQMVRMPAGFLRAAPTRAGRDACCSLSGVFGASTILRTLISPNSKQTLTAC